MIILNTSGLYKPEKNDERLEHFCYELQKMLICKLAYTKKNWEAVFIYKHTNVTVAMLTGRIC